MNYCWRTPKSRKSLSVYSRLKLTITWKFRCRNVGFGTLIGSKDGALPHYCITATRFRPAPSEPDRQLLAASGSPVKDRLGHHVMAVMFRITLGVSHEVSHLCTLMARNAFTCGSSPCGMLSIPPWWDVTPTTTTATLPQPALISAQARRSTEAGKSRSLPW